MNDKHKVTRIDTGIPGLDNILNGGRSRLPDVPD